MTCRDGGDRGLVANFIKRFGRKARGEQASIEARLEISTGRYSTTVLFGPSGCGKTTILRSLAGLERPETGKITFNDEVWFDAERSLCRPPQARGIGYCFQHNALFPHLTVGRNIAYGLSRSDPDRQPKIADLLARFQLAELEHRYPHQISGGEQQRVALARALVRQPRLLLLDEPFSSLDTNLRVELRTQLRQLLRGFGIPVVLVTHDRLEALALAERVVVIDRGEIQQCGPVEEVFSKPSSAAVARIVGMETLVTGEVREVANGFASVDVAGSCLRALSRSFAPRQPVYIGIQGEDVDLLRCEAVETGTARQMSNDNRLTGPVRWLTPEGPFVRVGIDCGFPLVALVPRLTLEQRGLRVGETTTASIPVASIHLMAISRSPDE